MRNLPLPSRDEDRADLRKAVRQYTYGGIMRGHVLTDQELDDIIDLYDAYDAAEAIASDVLKGADLPETLLETVRAAYDRTQEGRRLQAIRELILKDVSLCPVCGIGPADELDHHLPRSAFRPLAIFTHNLVPMCHPCNHAKLAGFGEAETGFLSPYYDILPDVDFLQVSVQIAGEALVVEYAIDETALLPAGYPQRLASQMTTLHLNDRYQQEVNTYLYGHAVALHMQFTTGGAAAVQSFLNLQAAYERGRFYRNHWRPVLLTALANHAAFTAGGFTEILKLPEPIAEALA